MKKCPKCNVELDDNAEFCANCGTNLNAVSGPAPAPSAAPTGNETLAAAKETNKNTKIGIIAVAAVAVVVLVLLIAIVLGGGGYKKALKTYMNAVIKGKYETMFNIITPASVREDVIDDRDYDLDYDEFMSGWSEIYKTTFEEMKKEGKGKPKLKFEIKQAEKLDDLDKLEDEIEDYYWIEDFDDFVDGMDDLYDDYDFDADKIKTAYAVEYKWEVDIKGEKVAKGTDIVIIYKYKGKWYMTDGITISNIVYELDSDDFEDTIEAFNDAYDDLYDDLY